MRQLGDAERNGVKGEGKGVRRRSASALSGSGTGTEKTHSYTCSNTALHDDLGRRVEEQKQAVHLSQQTICSQLRLESTLLGGKSGHMTDSSPW